MRSNANLSQRRAAAVYNVPETTLQRQRAKPASERVISPYCSKLTRQEEEVLVQYIRKLNARGFAPTLAYVREMAD
jgi:DNA mismatch repair ATPase MutL